MIWRACTGIVILGAVCAGLVAAPAALAGADPAEAALRVGDVYVGPPALAGDAGAAERRLHAAVARLAERRQPVKIAIVLGPSGAPSIRVYARRMRLALGFTGTLVVTAPRRAVVAIGPRPPAEITTDLRAARIGGIADPVDRAIRAAEIAVGSRPADAGGSSLRGLSVLLGLAVLGGAWAAAWGLRREKRHAGMALSEARAMMRLRLDALSARARDLGAHPRLDPAGRADLDQSLESFSEALAELERARTAAEVDRSAPALRRGLEALTKAGAAIGEPVDSADLFDGLCAVDPAHGAAARTARLGEEGEHGVCAACADAVASGEQRRRRVVPVGGRPVPFDEAPPEAIEHPEDDRRQR